MKNKKTILILSLIIVFSIIFFIVFFIIQKNNTTTTQEPNNTQIIKSTNKHKIEKDNLEVKELKIQKSESEISVLSTIINNSDSSINGFFIAIALVDKNGNTLTSVAVNYTEKIEPHKSIDFTNYVTGKEISLDDVSDAQIKLLKKY